MKYLKQRLAWVLLKKCVFILPRLCIANSKFFYLRLTGSQRNGVYLTLFACLRISELETLYGIQRTIGQSARTNANFNVCQESDF